LIEKTHLKTMY